MFDYYDLKKIRLLLSEGFSREDLLILCFDNSSLRPVYENFESEGIKSEFVRSIIDYSYRRASLDIVLNWAKLENPKRYALDQPYSQGDLQESTQLSTVVDQGTPIIILPIKNNDLGNDIILGGEFKGIQMKLVATDWVEYGISRQVRSGWLFIPQWTEFHAITFFKLHLYENGSGYIHITDTSDPEHRIWLTTATGFYKEKIFHYLTYPLDLWRFRWK